MQLHLAARLVGQVDVEGDPPHAAVLDVETSRLVVQVEVSRERPRVATKRSDFEAVRPGRIGSPPLRRSRGGRKTYR